MTCRHLILLVLSLASGALAASPSGDQAEETWFGRVEPLLDRYCFKCHGGVRQKSGLDLRSLENILKGGERGAAIIPGRPEKSRLYQFVLKGADPHMPLDEKKQLSDLDVAAIRDWISELPSTPPAPEAFTNRVGWANEYLKRLDQLHRPVWTPSAATTGREAIDRFVSLGWKQRHARPAAIGDDRTFLRRIYLDLAGRIPTLEETDAFFADRRKDKRDRLVDSLLAGPDYPRRMREVFDVVLMERQGESAEDQRRDHQWFAFLERAFRENYPWDKIVREIIVARPDEPADRGSVWFLYERKENYQAMAEAVAPIAFGARINCAQCHNHPLAWEFEQRHYWGLVAAFNRSKNVDTPNGPAVSELATGGFVSFANLKKESQPAALAFPNGSLVPEKRPADGEKEKDSPELYSVPPPAGKTKPTVAAIPLFSRRSALADAATHNNPQLARAFVNRMWTLLMGRGLVQPVDQLDSMHRPSHPDLLNWLSAEFERKHFDIKWLIREIVLSRPYQLDSVPLERKATLADAFASGLEKPLSGEQLYQSFLVATANRPATNGTIAGHPEAAVRRAFVDAFPDLFQPDYSASLQQAMFLSNSPLLDDLLQSHPGNTAASILAAKSPAEGVERAFVACYGRKPSPDEITQCQSFLKHRDAPTGVRELLWALLTSPEFLLNH